VLSAFVFNLGNHAVHETMNIEAGQVLKKWENYLNSGDLANIVGLYSSEAILWGTFSTIVRDNPRLIENYFQELFCKDQLRVHFSLIRSRVFNGTYLYSGTYEFSYMDGDPVTIPARFTFVVSQDKNTGYRIVEHHSSLIPDGS